MHLAIILAEYEDRPSHEIYTLLADGYAPFSFDVRFRGMSLNAILKKAGKKAGVEEAIEEFMDRVDRILEELSEM